MRRSSFSDWDPTKWIIWVLHRYTPFVPTISTTHESEVLKARAHVHRLHADRLTSQIPKDDMAKDDAELPLWTKQDVLRELELDEGAVFLLIDGYIVDVGGYLDIHVSLFAMLWADQSLTLTYLAWRTCFTAELVDKATRTRTSQQRFTFR